jgi:hypothetical protein
MIQNALLRQAEKLPSLFLSSSADGIQESAACQ